MLRPLLERVGAAMPDGARARFANASRDIERLLRLYTSSDEGVTQIDGIAPLAAYRRLLALALHQRMLSYELDSHSCRATPTSLSDRLEKGTIDSGQFVLCIFREIRALESVLMDFEEPKTCVMHKILHDTPPSHLAQRADRATVASVSVVAPLSSFVMVRRRFGFGGSVEAPDPYARPRPFATTSRPLGTTSSTRSSGASRPSNARTRGAAGSRSSSARRRRSA